VIRAVREHTGIIRRHPQLDQSGRGAGGPRQRSGWEPPTRGLAGERSESCGASESGGRAPPAEVAPTRGADTTRGRGHQHRGHRPARSHPPYQLRSVRPGAGGRSDQRPVSSTSCRKATCSSRSRSATSSCPAMWVTPDSGTNRCRRPAASSAADSRPRAPRRRCRRPARGSAAAPAGWCPRGWLDRAEQPSRRRRPATTPRTPRGARRGGRGSARCSGCRTAASRSPARRRCRPGSGRVAAARRGRRGSRRSSTAERHAVEVEPRFVLGGGVERVELVLEHRGREVTGDLPLEAGATSRGSRARRRRGPRTPGRRTTGR
jgi:hypothetical protein